MPDPIWTGLTIRFPWTFVPGERCVIIVLFGVLFALVWLGTYFLVFLQRATPRP